MRVEPRYLLVAMVMAMGLSVASCSRSESATRAPAQMEEGAVTVVPAAAVRRADISANNSLTAEFQPFQEVDVMAKVAGYVRTIRVDLGDRVREGQLLAELEVPEMTDEISKAAAAVEQSSAEMAAARDELRRAESSHEIAHLSHTRLLQASQREPGLIPQQELDVVRSRDLIAEAQLASAASRVRVEQQRVSVARAEETRLKTMRNYVTILAPFAGTVTRRYANLGSMIQAGIASQSQAMPLVRLSQLSTLRLSVPVPEPLAPAIRIGRTVEARVRSIDRKFPGRVARIASRVDTATRTMVAEVDVPNPGEVLMPGMYAEVTIESTQKDVLSVPVEAVDRAGNATRLFVIGQEGKIQIAPVQVGIVDAQRTQILSGAAENDLVVTGRRTGLKAGDRVTPKLQ